MAESIEDAKRNFARRMAAQCKTHTEWLALMRFGLPTLIEDQELLVECIFLQAAKEVERFEELCRDPFRFTFAILKELNLRLVEVTDEIEAENALRAATQAAGQTS